MNIAAKECEVTEVNARASQQQRPSSTSGISSEGSEQGGPKTCLSKKGNSSPKGTTKSPIKSKRRGSSKSYFGDEDFSFDSDVLAQGLRNAEDEVSFEEICYSCCYRGAREWLRIVAILVSLLGCLYFFLFGLQLMGNASKVMAGCASGQLFASEVSKFPRRREIQLLCRIS